VLSKRQLASCLSALKKNVIGTIMSLKLSYVPKFFGRRFENDHCKDQEIGHAAIAIRRCKTKPEAQDKNIIERYGTIARESPRLNRSFFLSPLCRA